MANTFTKAFYGKEVNYDLMHETLQHPDGQYFILFVLLLLCSTLQMAYGHS